MDEKNRIELSLKSFDAFVAKQIDQENRYRLFILKDTNIELGCGTTSLELGHFQFTINENFILFLASLTEYHFEETMNLIQFS